jgi:hypothetical protein
MEKILIEVEGTIHTFESIKEAANYRTDFLKRMESSLGNSPNERLYIDNFYLSNNLFFSIEKIQNPVNQSRCSTQFTKSTLNKVTTAPKMLYRVQMVRMDAIIGLPV